MKRREEYFIDHSPDSGGHNILHKEGCLFLPANTVSIGEFEDDTMAHGEARQKYIRVLKCPLCCSRSVIKV